MIQPILAQLPINPVTLVLWALLGIVLLVFVLMVATFASIWIRALFSGAPVKFTELVALRLRRVPVGMIVDTRITAVKSGLPLTIDDLSTHYLAGGAVEMVVLALIAARKAGIHLDFDRACAIDLATKGTGKTVLEAVKTSVNPKVIDCPNPASGKITIDAVAKDGIVIKAKARVTVRTNLERFVGGATEETIIARVGEGSSRRSARRRLTKTCWRTRTAFPRPCWTRRWTAIRRSKSSRSISRTWTWEKTWAPSSRPSRPRPTN